MSSINVAKRRHINTDDWEVRSKYILDDGQGIYTSNSFEVEKDVWVNSLKARNDDRLLTVFVPKGIYSYKNFKTGKNKLRAKRWVYKKIDPNKIDRLVAFNGDKCIARATAILEAEK